MTVVSPIRVLVVDDSAFMRKALSAMLADDPRVAVIGTARNGEEALEKIPALRPDVVTLDVEMPGMNGLEALRWIMDQYPMPVLMVSSLTEEGARETIQALEFGAIDYVPKQLDGVATNIAGIQHDLLEKVVAAAGMVGRVQRRRSGAETNGHSPVIGCRMTSATIAATRGSKVVAIGCSTGGPKALQDILPLLPADFPAGLLIVQHMPKYFTKPFAERMDQLSAIQVREACQGDIVEPGVALIAPGGMHMRVVRRRPTDVEIELASNREGLAHAPSVDILMESVAEVYGSRGVGVILTGMGHDGLEGMRAIQRSHGRTLAQDEASSVVYGMPKAVVEDGCAQKVLPLASIAGEIVNMV
ncbi:MAG TPA: chemotaxis response regulator protein-glutamate methylesterase [Nitrospirales bacterium]|nr:chemotaxis response regulator protein-glutamate methylesterase [Nitrospirales bacterium]